MALSQPLVQPASQIAAIRPLAIELYDATRGASLINQAQNELELLLAVLSTAENQSSLLKQESASPEFEKTISGCHVALSDLQKLQKSNGGFGTQSQISDIRARFSDLIFEMSVMNADMMISSQNQLNRLLRDFIDDIKVGKRDGKVITETLYSASRPEQDEAWDKLKQELQDVGVAPEMLVQDRETIMSTLRKAADQEGLLQPAQKPGQKPLEHAMPPADNRISDKEAVPIDDFPIPLTCELQDVDDSSKHAVPRDDFPILVSTEPPPDDFDKQVLPPDLNLPIPVETASTAHSQSGSASDKGSSVSQARSAPPLSISRGKKPSLMSRMKYKMSSSKSEFLTLIEMGGLYSIKFALDRGADVNSYDNAGKTALMIAVSLGLDDVVSLLLEYGAKIDQMGDHGDTALGIAALKGYDDIVQLLLVSGASPDAGKNRGKTALSQAVMRNSLTITKMLIAWGADINAISSSGNTALSCAALNGCYPIVQFLLENGAVVDKTSYPRQTPLYKAVSHANARCARLLLTFGADPHQKDSRGQSPMDLATTSFSLGKPEMLDLFHEYGFEDDAGPAGTAAPPPYQPPAGRKSILGKSAFQYS